MLKLIFIGFLVVILQGCPTPVPADNPVNNQAWSRFLLCELPPEHQPDFCNEDK